MPGAKVVCAASLTAGQSQEFAATAPTRALGRQRIWTRETAPARVAASALPRGLHAVAEIERARAALRTRARRLLAQAARTERHSTCLLAEINGNNGIMVECISATEMTRTRFPADALSLSLSLASRGPCLCRCSMSRPARRLCHSCARKAGCPGCIDMRLFREFNRGRLAPERKFMPLDQKRQLGALISQPQGRDCHGKAQARSRVSVAHPCYHCFKCVLARGGRSASGLDFFQLTSRLPWQAAARPSTTACVGHAAQLCDLSTCVGRATTARVA